MRFNPYSPFLPYLKPYRRAIIFGLLLLMVHLIISVAIPLLLKFAIDSIQIELEGNPAPGAFYSGGIVGDLILYAAIIAGLGLFQWLVAVGMRWCLTGSSRRVERDIRQIYVNHLLKLSLDFFQRQKIGDLMARSTSDVEAIQRFLHHAFRMSLTGILTFVLSLGLMSWICHDHYVIAKVLTDSFMFFSAREAWLAGITAMLSIIACWRLWGAPIAILGAVLEGCGAGNSMIRISFHLDAPLPDARDPRAAPGQRAPRARSDGVGWARHA